MENQIFEIHSGNIEFLEQLKTPSFNERADKFLEHLEKETTYAGQVLEQNNTWLSAGWCINFDELREVISFLNETERISDSAKIMDTVRVKIRPAGWAHLETLKKVNAGQKQGFVAMWFTDDMQMIYDDVISPAILASGYLPHRVDKREHNNKIDDEIIAQTRKSRFVFCRFYWTPRRSVFRSWICKRVGTGSPLVMPGRSY